jgi:hypothetical protein
MGEIFAGLIVEQDNGRTDFQPHDPDQIMRRATGHGDILSLGQRLFDKQARGGLRGPGGGCGHDGSLTPNRPRVILLLEQVRRDDGRIFVQSGAMAIQTVPDSEYSGFMGLLPAKAPRLCLARPF